MHHFFFLSHYKWFRCGFTFHAIDFIPFFSFLSVHSLDSPTAAAVLNATAHKHSNHLKWFMTEKLRFYLHFLWNWLLRLCVCVFCVLFFTRRMRKWCKLFAIQKHTHPCNGHKLPNKPRRNGIKCSNKCFLRCKFLWFQFKFCMLQNTLWVCNAKPAKQKHKHRLWICFCFSCENNNNKIAFAYEKLCWN